MLKKFENESIELKGAVKVQLFNEKNELTHEHEEHNLVVTVGKAYLASWIAAASQLGKFMSYIALGTGTATPTTGDTALQSEFSGGGYSRVVGTLSTPGSTNIWQNQATFGPGNGTGAITEAGLFSTVTSGTMFARNVFSVVNKSSGDTLVVTWQVTIG